MNVVIPGITAPVILLLFLLFYNLVITALLNSDLNTKTVS